MATLKEQIYFNAEQHAARSAATRKWARSKQVTTLIDMADYLTDKYELTTAVYTDATDVTVYLTAQDLEGLKDEKLQALLNSFIHAEPESMSNYDYPASFERVYRFEWCGEFNNELGYRPRLAIRVSANFKTDSETCKRVIVGYTEPSKEPTPIYELRCTDGDKAPAEETKES